MQIIWSLSQDFLLNAENNFTRMSACESSSSFRDLHRVELAALLLTLRKTGLFASNSASSSLLTLWFVAFVEDDFDNLLLRVC